MSRAAIQWLRNDEGKWDPVGIWFATPRGLTSRYLPGKGIDGLFKRVHENIAPPALADGRIGGWEDAIEYLLDALSNGHDLMVSEIKPSLTLDLTYAKEVLGLKGKALDNWAPSTVPNVTTIPSNELQGAGEGLAPARRNPDV
jgi:hypothetical protein